MNPEQLSQTAAFIAIKFYGLTRSQPYRSLFDEETILFYERLVSELPAPLNRYHGILQKPWLRKFFIFSEELLLPGDLMHILMRKWYIGKMAERLFENGYEQLLVLGSGFDHLALKYSLRGIPAFEIDAPHMSALKKDFLHKYDYANKQLHILPAHVSKDSPYNLISQVQELDPQRKTIVVAEGFFDYITPENTGYLLRELGSHFQQVALISTVFALNELNIFRAWIFKTGVWMVGEQLKLHLSKEDFSSMLKNYDFHIKEHITAHEMEHRLMEHENISHPVLRGFHLLEAEKMIKFSSI